LSIELSYQKSAILLGRFWSVIYHHHRGKKEVKLCRIKKKTKTKGQPLKAKLLINVLKYLLFVKEAIIRNSQSDIINESITYPSIPGTSFQVQDKIKLRNTNSGITGIRKKLEKTAMTLEIPFIIVN
jgi:hypothetical protein